MMFAMLAGLALTSPGGGILHHRGNGSKKATNSPKVRAKKKARRAMARASRRANRG